MRITHFLSLLWVSSLTAAQRNPLDIMTSKACCSIPPVVTSNYTLKGSYSEFAGMNTYVTGNKDAKTAVIVIFDVFGFYPQTQQGADIIAASGKHLVIMPDYFFGAPMDISGIPADTDEKKVQLAAFFAGPANLTMAQENTYKLLPEIKAKYDCIESWAVIGYCWGGKVATLLSGESSLFKASAQVHPAMVDPADAAKVTIPQMCLASKDEDAVAIAGTAEAIKNSPIEKVRTNSVVETYSTMHHGWMAARANLSDPENAKEYQRGYKEIVEFLGVNLASPL